MTDRGQVNLHLVLTIFLGVGMVLFGTLAVFAYQQNTQTQANLQSTKLAVATATAAAQKKQDEEANTKANESPYRSYVADTVDGGFQLQVPKNWSIFVGKNTESAQLTLAINPDKVVINSADKAVNTQAFLLELQNKSAADFNKAYQSRLKQKKRAVTSRSITVSGIQGLAYEGVIDDQRHSGTLIVLPVRDKAMVISNQNPVYKAEFSKILSGAKIIP